MDSTVIEIITYKKFLAQKHSGNEGHHEKTKYIDTRNNRKGRITQAKSEDTFSIKP